MPGDKTFPVFKEQYETQCERLVAGESFDIPMLECITEPPEKPTSKAVGIQHLAEILATLDS